MKRNTALFFCLILCQAVLWTATWGFAGEARWQSEDFNDAVAEKGLSILENRLAERGVTFVKVTEPDEANDLALSVCRDEAIPPEGFRLEKEGDRLILSASDGRGVLYGAGKILRGIAWDGSFDYFGKTGLFVPQRPIRAIYFATHFGNFYLAAPIEEVERYLEDLALYGLNTFDVWFDYHHYQGIDDPKAVQMIERLRRMLLFADSVGMDCMLGTLANEGYANSPVELRATPTKTAHYGVEICPSKPGGMERILAERAAMLDAFAGIPIRYIGFGAYDQGGCECPDCTPWGSRGFLKTCEAVGRLAREKFPDIKILISTWCFGYFHGEAEWDDFYAKMAEKPDWADIVLAEHHGNRNYPQYVLDHGKPGGLPLVSFPEISMHNMDPWGGFGANLQPRRIQSVWNSAKELLSGGFPYSEGIFEDANKFVCAQLFWSDEESVESILTEYACGFFSRAEGEKIVEAMLLLEEQMGHYANIEALAQARTIPQGGELPVVYRLHHGSEINKNGAKKLLDAVEPNLSEKVRDSWRWKLIRVRADLDAELTASGGRPTEKSEELFRVLRKMYHSDVLPDETVFSTTVPSLEQ